MAIADMIPGMDKASLSNLRDNARRLKASNDTRQQEQASALLPLIEAELAAREALKPPKKTAKKKVVKAPEREATEATEDAA
jgi:ABC-type transporter MlaC component